MFTGVTHARCRPLNSHDFIVCHTVSLPFLTVARQALHFLRFYKFQANFLSQTRNFLWKQTRQHNPLSKNIVALSTTHRNKNNFVAFLSEPSARCCPGNCCPVNYQKLHEKHLRDNFCNWTFFRTAVKNIYVGVLLLKKQTI